MVVIAVFAIFATIVLTSISKAKKQAGRARALAEMEQLANAFYYAKSSKGVTLGDITHQVWSAGPCFPGDVTPTPDHRGDTGPCYQAWIDDLNLIQPYTDGSQGDITQFKRDPWGSPYLLDENEGVYPRSGPIDCSNADTITSPGPNGKIDAWDINGQDYTGDDIQVKVANASDYCKQPKTGF
jgi:type II secretory pathway pseudopilin PulG